VNGESQNSTDELLRTRGLTMSQKQKYPGPLYAAAGFGDLAAEKLRHLPETVSEFQAWAREELTGGRERAQNELAELGGRIGASLASWRERAQQTSDTEIRPDLRKFQATARRRAGEFADVAQRNLSVAQSRATGIYEELVSRGESVLAGGRNGRPARKIAERSTRSDQPGRAKMAKKTSRPATTRKTAAKKPPTKAG
jgi:heparin binding hemagglutinin HbhA